MKIKTIIYLAIITVISCKPTESGPLPYLGQKEIIDGKETYHTVDSFSFYNQDSLLVTNELLKENIYLVDYFFTSCPSICPKVKKNVMRIQEKYKDDKMLKILSISIDTKRDSVPRLKQYADNLSVDQDQWWFLTGDKDEIMELASEFFIVAYEDADAPGGFDHSGKVVLVDKQGHIRAFAEGTDQESVDALAPKIDRLIAEYKGQP